MPRDFRMMLNLLLGFIPREHAKDFACMIFPISECRYRRKRSSFTHCHSHKLDQMN